jgi:hypothetical protein
MTVRDSRLLLIAMVPVLLTACGSAGGSSSPSTPAGSTTLATSTMTAIVGEWQRTTTCDDRVKALQHAGLGRNAAADVAGDGFIPGVTKASQLNDARHPCRGAISMKHSHFFTDGGSFGSHDEAGNQVDDGTWRQTDDHTIVIGPSPGDAGASTTFHFTITDNKSLRLQPVLPRCAKSGCFQALWAVNVSYDGLPWQRLP